MLGRLSLATQATLVAAVELFVLYLVQLAWLAGGGPSWLVLLTPVVLCAATVYLFTRYVHLVRLRALAQAFQRLAGGDLAHDLPEPLDKESRPVKAAYDGMRAALTDFTERLRRTDVARRQLFADLVHEIGTPVATVLALADGLALPAVDASPERRAELTAALLGEGQRLARLVGDLRDLADLDDPDVALATEPTDLAALVRDVCRRLALADEDGPRIEVEAPDALEARLDADRIEQVLVNVLKNAQRHAHGGHVRVVLAERQGRAQLSIEDDGGGVPDELLPQLGERLVRLDPSRTRATGGSGLGLSIVRAIVERHRGELRFGRASIGGLSVVIGLPTGEPLPAGPPAG